MPDFSGFGRGYNEAVDRNEARKARAQRLSQEAKLREEQIKQAQQQTESNEVNIAKLELELEQAELQNFETRKDISKRNMLEGITRFVDSGGDPRYIKQALSSDTFTQELVGYGNIHEARLLDEKNDFNEIQQIANLAGIPVEAVIGNPKYVKIISDIGTDVLDIETIMGATGYSNYVDQKKFEQAKQLLGLQQAEAKIDLTKAQIKKTEQTPTTRTTVPGTVQIAQTLANQEKIINDPNASLEQIEEATIIKDAIEKQITSSQEVKAQQQAEESEAAVTKFTYQNMLDNNFQFSKKDEAQMRSIEAGSKRTLSAEQTKTIDGLVSTGTAVDGLIELIKDADDDQFGLTIQNLQNQFNKFGVNIGTASEEEILKAAQSTEIQSKMGAALVDYVKTISGAAVTDFERALLTEIMTGRKYTTKGNRLAAIEAFKDVLDRKVTNISAQYADRAPFTIYRANQILNKVEGIRPEITGSESTDIKDVDNSVANFKAFIGGKN